MLVVLKVHGAAVQWTHAAVHSNRGARAPLPVDESFKASAHSFRKHFSKCSLMLEWSGSHGVRWGDAAVQLQVFSEGPSEGQQQPCRSTWAQTPPSSNANTNANTPPDTPPTPNAPPWPCSLSLMKHCCIYGQSEPAPPLSSVKTQWTCCCSVGHAAYSFALRKIWTAQW